MGSRIESLIRAAVQTFATKQNGSFVNANLSQNIQLLRQLLHEICPADDLGLTRNLGQPRLPLLNLFPSRTAPVTYMEIFENQTVSVGIFILKEGASIPLHDHSGMYGILKVLYGSVNIQSYSQIDLPGQATNPSIQQPHPCIKARRFPVSSLSETDNSVVLSPTENNLHTISTEGGPASFLDILAPPYDPDGTLSDGHITRDCFYYTDIGEAENLPPGSSEIRLLKKISCPSSFWCDSLMYQGPDIRHLHQELF